MTLTAQFVDGNAEEKLRAVLESGIVPAGAQLSTSLVDQDAQAGDLLGIALLINSRHPEPPTPPAPAVDDAARATVLAALRDTGFVTYAQERFPAANAAIVVTGGAAVAMARTDSAVAGTISTVDDVDIESGRITTVMAVSSLIGGGQPGQYGIGHGAGSVTLAQ